MPRKMNGPPEPEIPVERWAAMIDWTQNWRRTAKAAYDEATSYSAKVLREAYLDGWDWEQLQAAAETDIWERP